MAKFWNWAVAPDGSRELRLEGEIAEEIWFGDEVTPAMFREELYSSTGPVTVWINSNGGDVMAGMQIYNMLKEYPYRVRCKVDALAASAASVVAMAGDEVLMTPVSFMLIHNPWTMAVGDADDFEHTRNMLNEVKEGIINAYELKTRISRIVISHMMDDEEPMSAWKAVRLGFADGVEEADGNVLSRDSLTRASDRMRIYAKALITNFAKMNKPPVAEIKDETKTTVIQTEKVETETVTQTITEIEEGTPIESLEKRLSLITH